ncbi:unnamed protein product [Rhizoctonia solani]|uniref:DH domain-containing protein n=1 Tax=Rhizoctonia solani TaxID=456999 RepID=A0A8H3HPW6_9AGAM|nr:unnamed protein product [Rhizoctonia solani]
MKAFIRKLRRERSRERGGGGGEDEEKMPPPPPPKTMRADDSWLKHVSAPALSLPPLLPPTPTSAPLPATATPTPVPTPPAATPPPPPPAQRQPSPPPTQSQSQSQPQTQTHSTASSRPSQASEHGPDSAARRKVAFRSPPPTPGTIPVPLPEPESEQIQIPPPPPPQSQSQPQTTTTTYYRMRPNSATARFREGSSTPPKINTSGRTTATSGRVTHSPTQSTRTYPNEAASMTIRSGTPYSHMSGTSAIQAAASWSEAAENDLVSNLGSRERTRQEVLWEIVASEERYVGELIKLKETFIDSLLHPFAAVPPASLYHPADTNTILDEERASLRRAASPAESLDHLPIAARFLSPTPGPASSSTHQTRAETPRSKYRAPTIDEAEDSYDSDDEGKLPSRRRQTPSGGKSPYGTTAQRRAGSGKVPVPFPARSHQSLPPQQTRGHAAAASSHSLGRQSYLPNDFDRKGATSALKQRFQRRAGSRDMPAGVLGLGITAQQLPEDLRICLEVLEEVILPGHLTLREGLQKRYEEQYPLVRSLADIFVAHSHILRGYAKYVLHLERALEQVDNALSSTNSTKRPRNQNAAQWAQVCKALQRLEEVAAEKCETGLAISLSKPFQRLLKYPLLFQNLLFQTDPSTHEYESTLEMVAEVERIVRSIEDEKIQKEERDRTWDVFARIEGMDKIKQLAVPKPSRLLVNERPLHPDPTAPDTNRTVSGPPTTTPTKNLRGKSSLRRLSDVLQPGSSGKKDLWLVSFNDVVLRCQRTGVTTMPLVSGGTGDKLPATNGSGKAATVGRRTQVKPRNLYKFIKIETWTIGDVSRPRAGVVSMEDITKTRTGASIDDSALLNRGPIQEDDDEDEGAESDESDRKSKMSFSYWGADKITVQPTARGPNGARVPVRRIPGAPSSYMRDARTESSANAKFGTRLRETSTPERPASRTGAGSRTGGRRPEAAKPAWGTMSPIPASRRGSASLTPVPPVASSSTTPRKSTVSASPAPSVDSGIAVYLAQDRS